MSLFDKSRSIDLRTFRIDGIQPVSLRWDQRDTGARKDFTTDRNKEWEVRLTIAQNYWANDVQRPYVEKVALQAIAATLYEDVLREIPHLRLCIESGDKIGAFEAVDRITKATQP